MPEGGGKKSRELNILRRGKPNFDRPGDWGKKGEVVRPFFEKQEGTKRNPGLEK